MLPVLILARSQRQCYHWQRAVDATTLKLRLNPWVLNWRTLSTEVSCHLQEVIRPVQSYAFPSSFQLEESEHEKHESQSPFHATTRAVSSGVTVRLSRLIIGDLDKRAAQLSQGGMEEREAVSLLGLRLTPRHWCIIRLLLEHPLLSDEELAALLDLERKSVRCSLYELHQLACLEQVGTKAGKRWHLCERGLRLIAASDHMHICNIAEVPDDQTDKEASPVRQRGEAWFLQHIQHTAGIYGFFASLAQETRKEAGHELNWWETGAMCERRYRVGEHWYNLRPDAGASYRIGQQNLRFWLEWDRGTMNVRDLSIKFASYAHFIASREWVREEVRLPRLICIAPDIAQEKRIQRVRHERLEQTPGFVVCTTTEVLLNEHGPLAPIWLLFTTGRAQGEVPGSALRRGWSALISQANAL